jgi:hypothetical protein
MTEQEIADGNGLIAAYDGGNKKVILNQWKENGVFHADAKFVDIDYHKEWEYLMPVVEKIEADGYFVMINKWTSVYTGSEADRIEITSISGKPKILNTWKAIVEHLKNK